MGTYFFVLRENGIEHRAWSMGKSLEKENLFKGRKMMTKRGFGIFTALLFTGFMAIADGPIRTLELPPGPDNPRNSEGAFVTLKDGRVLFVYSHYTAGHGGDHDPAFLAGRISADGGRTWTEKDQVIVENEGGMNVMSVSLLRLQSGEIALFYLLKNSTTDCRPVMRISKDEGKTWGEPVLCITDQVGYYVLNNDRAIQLKSGRLAVAGLPALVARCKKG